MESPHPPLSPATGERDGVRGQRPPTVNFCCRLRNAFWLNRHKVENNFGGYILHLLS